MMALILKGELLKIQIEGGTQISFPLKKFLDLKIFIFHYVFFGHKNQTCHYSVKTCDIFPNCPIKSSWIDNFKGF